MTQRANILEELNELNSSLVADTQQAVYTVPNGYFDQLADSVLARIKALEATTAQEEINHLSPLLATAARQMPYSIPGNYFTELDSKAATQSYTSAKEELENISPLLGGLKKEMPYSVPAGYFESIQTPQQEKAKVVSLTSRKWLRYAAAAVVTGVIATTFFVVNSNSNPEQKLARIENTATKAIEKTSEDELNDFVQYSTTEQVAIAKTNPSEDVKDMLKGVPAEDLQAFLNEVGDPDLLNDGMD